MLSKTSQKIRPARQKLAKPLEIGWAECVDLPELGLSRIRAKIDTGAATSSIHATRIKPFERDGEQWVEFLFRAHRDEKPQLFEARAVEKRKIKSSNGNIEKRYVIETAMTLGDLTWDAHMTLANRMTMAFPILIGRRALKRGFRVNCAKRWTLGRPDNSDR